MRWAAALVAAGLVACGSGTGSKTVGLPCSDASVCDSAEQCMIFSGENADGTCSTTLNACSMPCQTDQDCIVLAGGLRCFLGCGGNPNFCAKAPG